DNAGNTRWPRPARAHHANVDVGLIRTRDEGFGPVQNVVIALTLCRGLQTGRIRTCIRLCQAVARAMFHRTKFWKKALAHRVIAEPVDHPGRHVVDGKVGRGRRAALREFFVDDRGVEARQSRAADIFTYRHATKAECRGLSQALDRKDVFFVPFLSAWCKFRTRELACYILKSALFLA